MRSLTSIPQQLRFSHQIKDFTPWLAQAENLAILGEALGLELELAAPEVSVGPFSADLLCQDLASEGSVVIENQLEKTNHEHLGKMLTYGAVLDASTVIWIAKRFTDEHRKTLDWLNNHTDEDLNFYGVTVELWRIGDSLPAPRFDLVSRPAKVPARRKGTLINGEVTEARQLQYDFWVNVRQELLDAGVSRSLANPKPQLMFGLPLGKSGIRLSLRANTQLNRIGVHLVVRPKRVVQGVFDALLLEKESIEKELGAELTWNPYPEKPSRAAVLYG